MASLHDLHHAIAPPDVRKLLASSRFLCEINAANYMMSNRQKVCLAMLIEGELWRAHYKQMFRYEHGAWVMQTELKVEGWNILIALEGLFLEIAKLLEEREEQIPWSWQATCGHVQHVIGDLLRGGVPILEALKATAKASSDHLRTTTGNKVWKAHWTRRVADMLASFRQRLENYATPEALAKLFLKEWTSAMPSGGGALPPERRAASQSRSWARELSTSSR